MIEQKYIDRFHTKYKIMPTGCWEWQGVLDRGYGRFIAKNFRGGAHRFSAKYIGGMKIDNLLVCHHCDNPSCVNPDHLFVGTNLDNALDRNKKNRTANKEKTVSTTVKLSEKDVLEIRKKEFDIDYYTKKYNVYPQAIRYIWSRKTWSWL